MAAYNYYYDDYGTSPRKLDPIPGRRQSPNTTKKKNTNAGTKKSTLQKNKKASQIAKRKRELELRKQKLKSMAWLGIAFAILLAISYRYSLINEQFSNLQKQKKQLVAIQKENEQIKINIENSINLNNIEKLAKERLGMKALDKSQIVYVNLDKKDYVESASEPIEQKQENIFSKLFN